MLRAWSHLAAQPGSTNALRMSSVENRTRPIETLEVWQPWKDDQNQETRYGDRNSIPRCSGGRD